MTPYTKPYYFLYSLPIALWGYFNDLPLAIVLGEVFFALLCIYTDYSKGSKEINFITVYSVFTLVYCYGNYKVISSIGTPDELLYDYYLIKENMAEGLFFTYLANVSCVLGFYYYMTKIKKPIGPIYTMNIELKKKQINYINNIVTAINVIMLAGNVPYATIFPFLITALFFLTRYAFKNDDKWLISMCITNTFILSINGLLFDYLRMSTIGPSIAFVIAAFFGKETIEGLFKKTMYPIYGLLIATVLIFSFMGKIRNKVSGYEKLTSVVEELNKTILEENVEIEDETGEEEESFEARVSNINQTTQVVRVVEEDGFYHGESMAYLSYAFIPRALWKDKPVIAQGVWFALRIGKAYVHEGGAANNSINMTSAGELYLNFGLAGVIVGMFIIGGLAAYMWLISGFADSANNVLGGMFGLYLFYLATSTFGVDLQFLVTMISYFCLFELANYLYLYFYKSQVKNNE
ncbi:MAG: hypothetical protein JWO58_1660 [Chitinophagaceae bacterium]|nr:hypothetical protein [Chitinophagaceae bacterium]